MFINYSKWEAKDEEEFFPFYYKFSALQFNSSGNFLFVNLNPKYFNLKISFFDPKTQIFRFSTVA
jgi:hypothetical protein